MKTSVTPKEERQGKVEDSAEQNSKQRQRVGLFLFFLPCLWDLD